MTNSSLRSRTVEVAAAAVVLFAAVAGCGRGSNKAETKTTPQPASDFAAKLQAIKTVGEPVVLADLDAWYPTPPADQNAAPLYAAAFVALVETDAKPPSFLTKNQKTLGLLHEAAQRTRCRYPVDFAAAYNAKLPHLSKIKTCVLLLKEATAFHAANGKMDLVAQDVGDGLRLAGSLEQEPILISQLIRVASLQITVHALAEALRRNPLSEPQLAELQSALQQAERRGAEGFTRCLVTERCSGISIFQSSPAELAQFLAQATEVSQEAGFKKEASELADYLRQPKYAADFAFYLDQMASLIACAKSPLAFSCLVTNSWRTQVDAGIAKGYVLSGILLPALSKAIERSATAVAELRAAQASLAVERFRLANGLRLPDSLQQLVPQYLASVPADPFDGQPLRYKKASPKGFVIYSVGPNLQDDGGAARAPVGQVSTPDFDLPFAILR